MEGIELIRDFAVLLLAAGAAGLAAKRLGLSVIVGYLVAGIIVGPHTPPFSLIVDEDRIMALSQVGLVFLMFGIGLGLSLSKFARLGAGTVIATVLGAAGVLVLTEIAGTFIGWSPLHAMFVAAMLMVSSSAVIAKVVTEQKRLHERASQTALAVTVLEDVVAVAMLTLLASQATVAQANLGGLGRLLGGLSAFVALLIGAGLLLVPRLMRRLETRADPEMQTVIVAGLLFALAFAAAKAGYSIALGAFLFGAIVAEIPQKPGVESSFRGLRDMFSSVFFVAIGMMIDVRLLADVWPAVLLLTAFALVARPLMCGFALMLVGTPPVEARRASLLLTPLGEFSFIIAQLGVTTAILPATYYPIAVGASILTILATPLMSRYREGLLRTVDRIEPQWVTRSLEAYHEWIVQLRDRPARTPWWTLLRPRLGQISVELLIASGLLIFSDLMLKAITGAEIMRRFDPSIVAYVYWSCVTLLVLVPVFAIWRNCSALAMLLGEVWESHRLPRTVIERTLKSVVLVGLASWLYLLLPSAPFAPWGWLLIAFVATAVVTLFSRRLVYWHSQWHSSVQEVLADRRADLGEMRAQARASLGENLDPWNVALGDATLAAGTAHAGKTLADLAIPERSGCAIIEIERNGHLIPAPTGNHPLYPGDKVLFFGPPDQVDGIRALLETGNDPREDEPDFANVVLDTLTVGDAQAGKSLEQLDPANHFDIRVVGIQRAGRRILTPPANELIRPCDQLLVLGTFGAIRQFRKSLLAPVAPVKTPLLPAQPPLHHV
ncbi:MAG: cation:proton antiporter [Lacunisphaera sp.]